MTVGVFLSGTNPLPNLVAFRYLLTQEVVEGVLQNDPLSELVLVYTHEPREMGDIFVRLRDAMKGAVLTIHPWPLHHARSPEVVRAAVQEMVQRLCRGKNVHLHYTGGTKVMSVHAHVALALEQARDDRQIGTVTSSYLDADACVLQLDRGAPWPRGGDLRAVPACALDVQTLLGLHGRDLRIGGLGTPPLTATAEALCAAFAGATTWSAYNGISNAYQHVRRQVEQNGRLIRDARPLARLTIQWPAELQAVGKAAAAELKAGDAQWLPLADLVPEARVWLAAVLHGKWLEVAVYDALAGLRTAAAVDPPITGLAASVVSWLPATPDRTAELDVAVMQGYQLTAISCTASREVGRCKEHAFEVLFRAGQQGGDAARSVLVTLLAPDTVNTNKETNLPGLIADLHDDYGVRDAQFTVLGIDSLGDLRGTLRALLTRTR